MMGPSMEDYLRDRLTLEAQTPDSLRARVSFPPDLQGPPEAGHGGGITAMLFELVRLLEGERGSAIRVPRPVRVEVALHRELPLDTVLQAEAERTSGGWHSRISLEGRPIAEAAVSSLQSPLVSPPPQVRRDWEASREGALELPGYAFCLGCGFSNPRGAQIRFDYNDSAVWKQLTPQSHFRAADGSLYPGYFCIVCDELGWWLGALRQGECGLSNRVAICLGEPVAADVPLLAVGARSAVVSLDKKGRVWQAAVAIVTPEWRPVATADVQFVGSRAFTKIMLSRFLPGNDPSALQRAFPKYAAS
ncbi:MAG TPA: hypothetical protein VEU07_08000 [Candidatus Acidoferrum sp.]|nr:hypothetical protein [Candidatus Acidoferrum sp.]